MDCALIGNPDITELKAKAAAGEAASQHVLGLCYVDGINIQKDFVAAANLLMAAHDNFLKDKKMKPEARGYLAHAARQTLFQRMHLANPSDSEKILLAIRKPDISPYV